MVVAEVDTLLTPAATEHEETDDSQQHPCPLPRIQLFAEQQHSAHEHHDGTRGVDGADDSQRQVLHAVIAKHPARQHEECLADNVFVLRPTAAGYVQQGAVEHVCGSAEHHKRQENERREQGVQEQHGNHRIALQRLLLQGVIHAQARSRQKCKYQPHYFLRFGLRRAHPSSVKSGSSPLRSKGFPFISVRQSSFFRLLRWGLLSVKSGFWDILGAGRLAV